MILSHTTKTTGFYKIHPITQRFTFSFSHLLVVAAAAVVVVEEDSPPGGD
jgi:hypothetical protein